MSKTKQCTICTHAKRAEIDDLLVKRTSFKQIAEEFGVGIMSVWRHSHNGHVLKAIAKAHEASEVARGDDLLQQVRDLQNRALGILKRAERKGDLRSASGAIREARNCLELLGKLAGELQSGVVVNVAVLPEWQVLRGRILVALEPYAEARAAVVKALEVGDVNEG